MIRIIEFKNDENGDTVKHYLPIEDEDVTREMLVKHIGYLVELADYEFQFLSRFRHLFTEDEVVALEELENDGYQPIYSDFTVFTSMKLVTGSKQSIDFKVITLYGDYLREYKGSHLKYLCQKAQVEALDEEKILKQLCQEAHWIQQLFFDALL